MKKANSDRQLSLFSDEDFGLPATSTAAAPHVRRPSPRPAPPEAEPQAGPPAIAYDHTQLFRRLSQSAFRCGFHLRAADIAYIRSKGLATIRQHAADFVARRLAPAVIPNDGRQTPMRGHPVFLAQHATACCCRGCFCKWHHIPAGRQLTPREQAYAVSVLMTWIQQELEAYTGRFPA